jgi:hypothetical protein
MIDVNAATDLDIDAGRDVFVSASNSVKLDAVSGSLDADAGTFVDIDAGSYMSLTAQTDAVLEAVSGKVDVNAGTDLDIDAGRDVFISASNSVTLDAVNGDLDVNVGSNIDVDAGGSMSYTAQNDALFQAVNGTLSMTADSGNVVMSTADSGKHVFRVGATDVVQIYRTSVFDPSDSNSQTDYKVRVNADFDIVGIVNSIGVTQTTLQVEDKTIRLAYESGGSNIALDGMTNDGAGLIVDGMPAGGDSNLMSRYEKSIRWNKSTNGVLGLGTNTIAGEPFWEVKGAGMRWTLTDPLNGDETTFGFRINNLKEFELYRRDFTAATTAEVFSKVARFGRVL